VNVSAIGRATHVLLRIVSGLLFLMHGGQKLLGWFPTPEMSGAPPVGSLIWFAGVLELVGGALILLGLLTRPVAFLLAGEMAVAYFMVHFPNGFWPMQNHGEAAVLFCFIFLYLFGNGDGGLSVDALMRRGRTKSGTVTRPMVEPIGAGVTHREDLPRR